MCERKKSFISDRFRAKLVLKTKWYKNRYLCKHRVLNLIIYFFTHFSSADAAIPKLENPAEENTRIRRQLALAYRLIDRLQLNEGACNHLTAMAPAKDGKGQIMLVVPGKAFIINLKYILLSS